MDKIDQLMAEKKTKIIKTAKRGKSHTKIFKKKTRCHIRFSCKQIILTTAYVQADATIIIQPKKSI
jgi:hypothetical protein